MVIRPEEGFKGFVHLAGNERMEKPMNGMNSKRLRLGKIVTLVCILLESCVTQQMVNAFPTKGGLSDSVSKIVNGREDLTDIFGVLFIPCVIAFVLSKRTWVRFTTGGIWILDMLVYPDFYHWVYHISATVMLGALVYFVRWNSRKLLRTKAR